MGCKGGFLNEWKQIKHRHNSTGYPQIRLRKNSKAYFFLLHILVAKIFIGPCPNGMEVCHNDNNKNNINILNLRYDTHQQNCLDAYRDGLNKSAKGSTNVWAKLTEEAVENILIEYYTTDIKQSKISTIYNVSTSVIRNILSGKKWQHVYKKIMPQIRNFPNFKIDKIPQFRTSTIK